MSAERDKRFMKMALGLGRRGMGKCAPNPAVGCVIQKDGVVIGRGWTQAGGRPHAEPQALSQAGAQSQGATAYVTLEPCSHEGQTPPCASALIKAGVKRVVVALTDPDPRVSGRGIKMLKAAGIEVTEGVLAEEAYKDHAGFLLKVTQRRPFVTLKLASSFDGRIATGSGQSQWITGPEARRVVHSMRSRHDAVMVGGGTARSDDPSLTVRDLGVSRQPARVVVSRRIDLPLLGQLARSASKIPLVLCHGQDADPSLKETWAGLGATLLECTAKGAQLDPQEVLGQLADLGTTRVFCEGGGGLAASLIDAQLVDRFVWFTAGMAIGAEGLPSIGALGLSALQEAHRFELTELRQIGDDVLHVWDRNTERD
ncbi:MAG: bifunctional diaminohydroxyphosphoribosylaminopyrimidine deaminase/5-amino-6-(5-phosphoribosylamino)uracil reductase RibD [Paracoccaceae bacterium]